MQQSSTKTNHRLNIFYFEDNPGDVRLIQEYLKSGFQEGFEFKTAQRIEEGIKTAQEFDPDVILLDLSLVDSFGKETYANVHHHFPDIPIIIISENKDKDTAIKLIDQGAQDYLVKGSINDDNLYRAINYSLERKAHELKIRHLNIIQESIRNINQIITKENKIDSLLQKACNKLVETEGYINSWILLNGKDNKLYLDNRVDIETEKVEQFKKILNQKDYPCCLRKLFANGSVVLIEQPEQECRDCIFAESYTSHSKMLAKLKYEDEEYGIISVSIPKPYESYREELNLFREIARDIAFGIKDINTQIRHRQADQALKRSQRLHKEAQKVARIGHWELIPGQDNLKWSEQLFHIFNLDLSNNEPDYDEWKNYFDAEDWKTLNQKINESIERTTGFQLTLNILPNHNPKWIQIIGSPKSDKTGKVKKIFGTIQDVTLRKETEEELRKERNLLEQIAEASPVGITRVDKEGNIIFANSRAEEVLGVTKSEIKGRKYNDVEWRITDYNGNPYPDQDLPFEIVRRTDKPVYEVKHAIQFPNGERKLLSINSAPLKDEKGKFNGMVSGIEDITKKVKAEEILKSTKERLQLAIEGGDLGTWDWDLKTDEVIFNERWANMLGYELDEIEPHISSWKKLVHPDDLPVVQEILNKHLADETDIYEAEFRMRHKSGSWIWIQDRGKVIDRDAKGNPNRACGTHLDITERKKAEKEQKSLNNQLKEKNKELEQLLYATSHDLRSPLVNIKGFNKELKKSIDDLLDILNSNEIPPPVKKKCDYIINEDIPESMYFISSSTAKMDSLLSGLLTLSRLGRKKLEKKHINMNEFIYEVVSNFEYELKENNIEIQIANLPDCKADAPHLNQIFSNLISNAIKYMHPKRDGIIKISGREDKNHIHYSVEDNGIGIPENFQNKIFNLFHQNNPEASGIGLGLNIVKQILNRHDGNIQVKSKIDKGSKFTISLPSNK